MNLIKYTIIIMMMMIIASSAKFFAYGSQHHGDDDDGRRMGGLCSGHVHRDHCSGVRPEAALITSVVLLL